jgi:hypothetical protein
MVNLFGPTNANILKIINAVSIMINLTGVRNIFVKNIEYEYKTYYRAG